MKAYMRLELLRTLRDPFYLFLAVVVPIGFYLLFSGLFGSETTRRDSFPGNIEIMVALAVYGGIWACLVTTGPRLANERSSGWFRQLSLLPLAPWKILVGRMLVAILFALPSDAADLCDGHSGAWGAAKRGRVAAHDCADVDWRLAVCAAGHCPGLCDQ